MICSAVSLACKVHLYALMTLVECLSVVAEISVMHGVHPCLVYFSAGEAQSLQQEKQTFHCRLYCLIPNFQKE